MYGKHLEAAYWTVLRQLTFPSGFPEAALRKTWPAFEAEWNDRRKAGRVLHDVLLPTEWDWSAWRLAKPDDTVSAVEDDDFLPDPIATRRRMAVQLAGRITTVAYAEFRYEQLGCHDLQVFRPNLTLRWIGTLGLDVHPVACQAHDGKTLPYALALREFPHLPCDSLICRCELEATK